jgi:hypothetical protein
MITLCKEGKGLALAALCFLLAGGFAVYGVFLENL